MRALATLLLALWLLIASGPGTRADPISIAILTTIGITATTTAVAVTTFALTIGASIGLSYLSRAINRGRGAPQQEASTPIGGTSGKLSAGGIMPRSFIVGYGMTGGKLAYANSFGESGKTPNAYFVQVISLADIPVTGLNQVWINGAKVTWNPAAPAGPDGITIPEFTVNGVDHLWVRFYDGTQTAADARLVSLFGADPDRPYTNRRIGYGVPYVVVTALVNSELFASFPTCKFVVQGAKLYDRRYDSTAGGSGPQRWSDPSTWAFTENVAVIRENVLRGIRYAGAWQWGGQTITDAQLPSASWFGAANECDASIALVAGGSEPQYRAGGEIRGDQTPADVIEELCKADNGRLAEIGGVYKTRSGAAGAAVLSFTDADILISEPQRFEPFASQASQINHITGRYVSEAEGWAFKDAPPLVDVALESADGRRLSVAVDYGFVRSGTQVQRLMRSERADNRAWRRHALPMPPDTFVLEPLDVVSWTSDRNGYAAKTFEVASAEDLPNLNMGLALKELDPDAYNWVPGTHERPITDGTITILRPAPQPIVAWFADPYVLQVGNKARAAIQLGWDPATADVDGIRFEVRVKATSAVVLTGEEGQRVFDAGSLIVSHNLIPATLYQARGQYRPASPRPTLWGGWLDVTTPDTRVTQEELSAELDARVRQVSDQFQAYVDELRREIDELASATNDQASIIGERLGRTVIALGARYGENKASITQEALVRADEDSALAGLITVLEAEVDSNTARITTEELARADGDSALSGRISAFLATSGYGTAEGKIRMIAASAPSGVVASFAIEVNVSTGPTPNWQPSGIYLDAMAGFSRIRLVASQIKLSDPGLGGGVPFDMLTVGGGVATLNALLYAQKIVADSISTLELQVNGVALENIIDEAVSSKTYVNGSATGNVNADNVLIVSGSLTTKSNRAVDLLFHADLMSTDSGDLGGSVPPIPDMTFVLKVDGGTVATVTKQYGTYTKANTYASRGPLDLVIPVPSLSIGSHSFQLYLNCLSAGFVSISANRLSLEQGFR